VLKNLIMSGKLNGSLLCVSLRNGEDGSGASPGNCSVYFVELKRGCTRAGEVKGKTT
jgi:hypothetical protein